ncbi:MAG: carboxypeptidase regulatory-like domain-containing protein, partial [Chloroflexi bacterium]|nr:carboxypeptidase regulatory-like domain-containing protein [Chloroflexota bacterium]
MTRGNFRRTSGFAFLVLVMLLSAIWPPKALAQIPPPSTTDEADLVALVGDIDNFGFGFAAGFDVFSGKSTSTHSYPWKPGLNDPSGTDRIMVGSSYVGRPPAGYDGYASTTSRPDNLPKPIDMQYSLAAISVRSATLQMFVDDFQAPVFTSKFQVTLNGQRAPFLESVLNALNQSGPVGKLITVPIPADFLSQVTSGRLSIYIDDPTTGAGDGFAIDFARLLINPRASKQVGTVSGKVTDAATGQPISGVTVSASGVTAQTGSDGLYTLTGTPAGLAVVTATKNGYTSLTLSA